MDRRHTSIKKMTSTEIIFVNEHPKPPPYLTTKFIEAAVRKKHPEIQVININIVPAVSPGENYICTVFRVHVSTNEGPFSLIIKCVRDSHFNIEFNANNCYTEKERKFYSSFIPLFDTSIQPNVPLCYDVFKDGNIDCIILKDMSREGYQVYNRLKGFDKVHCEIVLKELAKLHALSLKLRIEDPEMFKSNAINQFQKPKQNEKYGALKISKTILSKYSQDIRECYPFRYHSIAKVIDDYICPILDILQGLPQLHAEDIPNKVLVLNHGDAWTNNLLFRYDDDSGLPIKCCMIDFQLVTCLPPVRDLMYFFFTTTTKKFRDKYLHELLQLYLDQVYLTLDSFGIFKPSPSANIFYKSVDDIILDMKENVCDSFIRMSELPLILANNNDLPDFETICLDTSGNLTSISLKHNKILRERFLEVLDDFDDLGCFTKAKRVLKQLKAETHWSKQ